MITRDEVLETIRVHRDELERLGVTAIWLFGSVARGEAKRSSDVDLLVDLCEGVTLFHFIGIQHRLAEILGAEIDLAMRDGLRPGIRENILAEVIPVFWGDRSKIFPMDDDRKREVE